MEAEYDRKRPIYSHKKGKALAFGNAWLDFYIRYGCDPDLKDIYLTTCTDGKTVDVEDEVTDEDMKRIDVRNTARTFIRRYNIREWVMEQKAIRATEHSTLVKNDYISILNSIVVDTSATPSERMKALQQVTKMLGIEGASKVEAAGGFALRMDWKEND